MGDIRLEPSVVFFTHQNSTAAKIPPQLEHANGHKDQSEFLLTILFITTEYSTVTFSPSWLFSIKLPGPIRLPD